MLSKRVQKNLIALGYTKPTPIQISAIPLLIKGRDVLASSQTGTGKSASFILPMLENLPSRVESRVGDDRYKIDALILAPTRELVVQIDRSIERYSRGFTHTSVALYGGIRLGGQIKQIRAGANIAVATTGRLLEHIKNGTINLSDVKIVIIDEADRLLEMGFIDNIREIISKLPKNRQSAMFSATFPKSILKLAKSMLKNPITINMDGEISAKEIKQSVYYIEERKKLSTLLKILKEKSSKGVLVFVNRKREADNLVTQLRLKALSVVAIHGNKSQSMRDNALQDFKDNRVDILIATDVVARGIDIKGLPLVINFELPLKNEDYIHRIGRTGRAKRDGEAISLVSKQEREQLSQLEEFLDITLPIINTEGSKYKSSQKRDKKLKQAKELAQKMMNMDKKSPKKSNKS
jgi:ATP-dependent RNA helicase RhlE